MQPLIILFALSAILIISIFIGLLHNPQIEGLNQDGLTLDEVIGLSNILPTQDEINTLTNERSTSILDLLIQKKYNDIYLNTFINNQNIQPITKIITIKDYVDIIINLSNTNAGTAGSALTKSIYSFSNIMSVLNSSTLPVPITTTPVPITTTPVPIITTPVQTTSILDYSLFTSSPFTSTLAPTTTTPVPTTTTPVPTTTTPVPTTTTPVPTTTTPVPTTTTPVPTTTTPVPTTTTPVPTTTTPVQTTSILEYYPFTSSPFTSTPAPTTTPVPTTTTPVPTTTTPVPTTTTPVPTTTTPVPTTTTPVPTTTTPVPTKSTTKLAAEKAVDKKNKKLEQEKTILDNKLNELTFAENEYNKIKTEYDRLNNASLADNNSENNAWSILQTAETELNTASNALKDALASQTFAEQRVSDELSKVTDAKSKLDYANYQNGVNQQAYATANNEYTQTNNAASSQCKPFDISCTVQRNQAKIALLIKKSTLDQALLSKNKSQTDADNALNVYNQAKARYDAELLKKQSADDRVVSTQKTVNDKISKRDAAKTGYDTAKIQAGISSQNVQNYSQTLTDAYNKFNSLSQQVDAQRGVVKNAEDELRNAIAYNNSI